MNCIDCGVEVQEDGQHSLDDCCAICELRRERDDAREQASRLARELEAERANVAALEAVAHGVSITARGITIHVRHSGDATRLEDLIAGLERELAETREQTAYADETVRLTQVAMDTWRERAEAAEKRVAELEKKR